MQTKCSYKSPIFLAAVSITAIVILSKVEYETGNRMFRTEGRKNARGASAGRAYSNSAISTVDKTKKSSADVLKRDLWHDKTCAASEFDWGEEWNWAKVKKPQVSHCLRHPKLLQKGKIVYALNV